MTLKLAPSLKLPDNFATEGVAVIGMRGSGKTNTEVRWCEQLYDNRIPFVVIEPKGDWGGIRSSADGTKPGLSVPVFGGHTGDFPLTEHLGARIADLLVNENMSAVLDVSLLSREKRARFLIAFFDQLMARHQHDPHVRCVIMEEAHRYIPQVIPQGPSNDKGLYGRLKEAAAAVLLEGRAWGLGCWAATQRPARLHKDLLEEVGTAIVHRIGVAANNDLTTVKKWVQFEDLGPEIIPSLTKLPSGTAWILAPNFGIVTQVQIDRRRTFDSAATPLVGAVRRSVTMADIDSVAIEAALADAIEKAVADDPVTLRNRIKELERLVAKLESREPEPVPVPEPVPFTPPALIEATASLVKAARGVAELVDGLMVIESLVGKLDEAVSSVSELPAPQQAPEPPRASRPKSIASRPRPQPADGGEDTQLSSGEQAVLVVLRDFGALPNKRLALQAGYSPSSSTIRVLLGQLRAKGYVNPGQPVTATAAGIAAIGGAVEKPTGDALIDYWMGHSRLGDGDRRVLSALIAAHRSGDELDKDDVCERAQLSPTSSTIRVIMGKLRGLGLASKGGYALDSDFAEAIG